jgi:hypothetical protein
MEVSLLVGTLERIPAAAFLAAKEGSPLFRTTQAMRMDERNSLIRPGMQILCRRVQLTGGQRWNAACRQV